jgi:hypothetical protein
MRRAIVLALASSLLAAPIWPSQAQVVQQLNVPPEGFKALFNGRDLAGWKLDEKADQNLIKHWKVIDGVLDYDGRAGHLWTESSFRNFVLLVDWRLKTAKDLYGRETEADGSPFTYTPDSGIYLRGASKSQLNLWANALGSGEVYGYRTDKTLSDEVRKGATPLLKADKPLGEWNRMRVEMRGDRLTVFLNEQKVLDNAHLPGVPERGPLALQHHGRFDEPTGRWGQASACLQFRNIFIQELPDK